MSFIKHVSIHTGASVKYVFLFISFRHSWPGGVWGNEGAVHALRRRILTGVCTKRPGQVIQRRGVWRR